MTHGSDPIVQTVYKQTGDLSSRIATKKDIEQGQYLIYTEGLTKREYFAAMAMQTLDAHKYSSAYSTAEWSKCLANDSVAIADALIEALNKTK